MTTTKKVYYFIILVFTAFITISHFVTQTPVNWLTGSVLWLYMFLNTLYSYLESKDRE